MTENTVNENKSITNKIRQKYNNVEEIVKSIFSEDFLIKTEIKSSVWKNFIDNPILKIATLELDGTKRFIEREKAKFEMLLYALNNQKLAAILQNSPGLYETKLEKAEDINLLSEEVEVMTKLAQEIVQIEVGKDGEQVNITFNYGKILQRIQNEYYDDSAPITAADSKLGEKITITLEKEPLLKYLENIFEAGLIFKPADNNQLTPIMFHSKIIDSDPHSFYLLLDNSCSISIV